MGTSKRSAIGIVFTLLSCIALADAPLPPHKDEMACVDGFCAVSNVAEKKTTLFKLEGGGKRTELWSVPDWGRSLFLSSDGKYVAYGYDGLNLLSSTDPEQVMVTFYSAGAKTSEVKLGLLVKNPEELPQTASHWLWGKAGGFDASGQFVITLHDGTVIKIDPATGVVKRRREVVEEKSKLCVCQTGPAQLTLALLVLLAVRRRT